ncbi:MAG TPA: DUF4013 domain-containing protein [Dokdonella sp.]
MTTTNEEAIVPFWERLREISLYPAHPAALTTIAALALSQLVVGYLPFGFFIGLIVWVALYKYAFECLRASANGRLEPPEIGFDVGDELGRQQILLQLVFIILGIVFFAVLGPFLGVLALLVLGFAYPAATMSLAMEESLPGALNPGKWFAICTRFGWPYLAVVLLCLVIFISQAYAQSLVASVLPGFLATLITAFISDYAIVATFHLMGYLIYQYHDEVGYTPMPPLAALRTAADDPDQVLLDEAAELLRDGYPEEATDHLGTQIRARGGSDAMHTQYRKLLALSGRRDEQLRHGREWISILLAQDKDRKAMEVARECLALDAAFQPAQAEQITHLAAKAADASSTDLALQLVSGFHKRYPKHRDIPQNYLLAAKLLAERKGKDTEARALLDQLVRAYPEHPLAADIKDYRLFLDKLAAPGKPAAPT